MNLAMFYACVAGYQDRLFDNKLLAVYSGFWSAYFMSPKSKSLDHVLRSLEQEHTKGATRQHADDVDVEAFLEQERRFKERLHKQGK